jgi:hypothetical protein
MARALHDRADMRLPGLVLLTALAGCVDDASTMPTAPNQLRGDDKSDVSDGPLWAGLTSVTFSRYSPDPCNNGATPLVDVAHYDDWVRQRAAIRHLCFEVWKPGVTDWDNPEFWKQLDVQVHYRFGDGEWKHEYVNSIDRRGNNRRYAWTLDWGLDPLAQSSSVAGIKVPFRITSETDTFVRVEADLQVYFTVDGRVLDTHDHQAFIVRYYGYGYKPTLAANDDGYVLHDIVTCEGGKVRLGSGAGFFAADIRVPSVVAALGAGLDGSMIYGVPTARGTENLSFTYGTQNAIAPGQSLPGFSDHAGMRIVPDGDSMRIEIDAYDRALERVRPLVATVTGCVLH